MVDAGAAGTRNDTNINRQNYAEHLILFNKNQIDSYLVGYSGNNQYTAENCCPVQTCELM